MPPVRSQAARNPALGGSRRLESAQGSDLPAAGRQVDLNQRLQLVIFAEFLQNPLREADMWTPSYGAEAIVWIFALVVACLSVAAFVLRLSDQPDGRNVGRRADGAGTGIAVSSTPSSDKTDLLRLRMGILHIDANELARSDPARLGELDRICAKCADRQVCEVDLAHPSPDVAWGEWRDYCPNSLEDAVQSDISTTMIEFPLVWRTEVRIARQRSDCHSLAVISRTRVRYSRPALASGLSTKECC